MLVWIIFIILLLYIIFIIKGKYKLSHFLGNISPQINNNKNTPLQLTDIPPFDMYQLMEQPSDPRYVYIADIGGYLLPYHELDFGLQYHRWMYHYFREFYNKDDKLKNVHPEDDLYYGGHYGHDYGSDRYGYRGDYYGKYGISPYKFKLTYKNGKPFFDTSIYPTKETGFAGGLYSQRYSGTGTRRSGLRVGYDVPSFQGQISEPFCNIENDSEDEGLNWPTANGLPAYPTFPVSENYSCPREPQIATSYAVRINR